MNLIEKAQQFAHEAHDSIGQKRKYTGEPYWIHTDEVAEIVREAGGTDEMIIAAHFHDLREDVYPINPAYFNIYLIGSKFGDKVVQYVIELTDVYTTTNYPNYNRAPRKQLEAHRLWGISAGAQTIKVADTISNTKSIVKYDPGFAINYLKEKEYVLFGLDLADKTLLNRALEQLKTEKAALNII